MPTAVVVEVVYTAKPDKGLDAGTQLNAINDDEAITAFERMMADS